MPGETITRQRADAAADPYSGEATRLDWTTPSTISVADVKVAPAGTSEPLEVGAARTEDELTLYVPFDADIEPLDRVVVRGKTYEVQGQRGDWSSPYTGIDRVSVVQVRRVTGA
jgi:hypothetical protein